MSANDKIPETLLEAVAYFANEDVAIAFVAALRWPTGPVCPSCDDKNIAFMPTRKLWKCRVCKRQFSVKVGNVFEDSPIPLSKWLPALWLIVNRKNGISSYEVARDLHVTQKTAWFMLHRLRLAMQTKSFDKFEGEVEVDETYIGGRARFMHKDKRAEKIKGTGGIGKAAVMGLLQRYGPDRHSVVRTAVIDDNKRRTLHAHIRENVAPGSEIHSDALKSYERLGEDYTHQVIDHAHESVRGNVHTNGMENFWSLLKRGIKGTYVSVEPFHLFRYLDEQAFRFNNRKLSDCERFMQAAVSVIGRRLTYKELIGEAGLAT